MGNRGRREDRAPAGAHGPRAEKSTRQNHRLSRGYPAFPAQWFYGLYAISPVTMLFCHRHPQGAHCALLEFSACIGAPGPRDFAVRTHAARRAKKSRPAMCGHRIPCPTSVTIASRPSCGHETGESIVVICPTTQGQMLRQTGTTGNLCMACMQYAASGLGQRSRAPTVPRLATPALDRSC
jgi:hypothetical protein